MRTKECWQTITMTGIGGFDCCASLRIILLELIQTATGIERTSQESKVRAGAEFSFVSLSSTAAYLMKKLKSETWVKTLMFITVISEDTYQLLNALEVVRRC